MLALFADTGTIRAHGAACAAHTADLAALAAVLRTLPSHLPSLGPAADRFAAVFLDALDAQAKAVAALGDQVVQAGVTAQRNAAAYDAAGHHAATLL
ncbi:hypothetical protein [Mycolicibacterium smegmatis]|uniref:Uncharacterized protein n=2 Tax=Mycolicibacterium smegmatis TaxID=1772 RepID=A0QT25_MYCS2|nr:hypothetical protein [Mycolicibacterium smegmatis]ABK75739.1 hypothetical protein MSMEG_1687 [Mycolicibacterium smegmatis MC2 155]MCC3333982.1 hypothetical protein [Mycolicibacterium smegmatis]MCO4197407.1 hypothetical protein [Mycolicibacterium smegmatis]TBH33845.1 hypothetical protein EYS45_21160 [Mycolicibacterium smegmatis MC2 155]TBM46315.1 hypothetical protein DIQ86_13250 [Mycolicibacterium smegmatis]